jgi:hypothetical protein
METAQSVGTECTGCYSSQLAGGSDLPVVDTWEPSAQSVAARNVQHQVLARQGSYGCACWHCGSDVPGANSCIVFERNRGRRQNLPGDLVLSVQRARPWEDFAIILIE